MKILQKDKKRTDVKRFKVVLVELNLDGTIGGSYFSLFYLVSGLDKTRFVPIVIFLSPNDLVPKFEEAGIDTRVFRSRKPVTTKNRLIRPFFRLFNFLNAKIHSVRSIVRYTRFLRSEGADLLHLNNSIELSSEWMMAAKLAGVPCVTHERGLLDHYARIPRMLAPSLRAVLCISKAVRENLVDKNFGSLPLHTVPNGLDPKAMKITKSVESIRAQYGVVDDKRLIGIVGNIQAWKGQDVLIRAMIQLRSAFPNLVCLLIGDVSPHDASDQKFHQQLQGLVQDNGLQNHVVLTGYRQDVANHVNALEILVHTSVEPEPFGRVLLEGMALCKPIVASRAGGVEEIVLQDVTGLLCTPGNSDEYANSIARLLSDAQYRSRMGEAGYQRLVAEFDIAQNVKTTEKIYLDIVVNQR